MSTLTPLLGEVIYRRHASPLGMGYVGDHFDLFDLTVFHRYERVEVASDRNGRPEVLSSPPGFDEGMAINLLFIDNFLFYYD